MVKGEPGDRASRSSDCPWDEAMYQLMPLATPTFTHRAITQLVASGHVQHVISQNEDGLHRRASLPADRLSELHGNACIELCSSAQEEPESSSSSSSADSSSDAEEEAAEEARAAQRAQQAERSTARALRPPGCGALVVRDFVTYHGDTYKRSNPAGRHVTRRACPRCAAAPTEMDGSGTASNGDGRPLGGRGWLLDSVVDFGETPGGPPWGVNPVHNYVRAPPARPPPPPPRASRSRAPASCTSPSDPPAPTRPLVHRTGGRETAHAVDGSGGRMGIIDDHTGQLFRPVAREVQVGAPAAERGATRAAACSARVRRRRRSWRRRWRWRNGQAAARQDH